MARLAVLGLVTFALGYLVGGLVVLRWTRAWAIRIQSDAIALMGRHQPIMSVVIQVRGRRVLLKQPADFIPLFQVNRDS